MTSIKQKNQLPIKNDCAKPFHITNMQDLKLPINPPSIPLAWVVNRCYESIRIIWARPPLMMDAISATIFDGGRAIRRKYE